jgi:hypothetical protein
VNAERLLTMWLVAPVAMAPVAMAPATSGRRRAERPAWYALGLRGRAVHHRRHRSSPGPVARTDRQHPRAHPDHAVVAEGIETAEVRGLLLEAGCRYGQGYLFSRPIALEQAAKLLQP